MSDFSVEIKKDKYMGECISITQNGHQWTTSSLGKKENLIAVRDAINEYLELTYKGE